MSTSIKLKYIHKRSKSSYATPPSNKSSSIPTCTGINLGPGTYNHNSLPQSPSFKFSRLERFNSNTSSKIFNYINDNNKLKLINGIEKNREITIQSISEKAKIVKNRVKKHNFRAEIAKITKNSLVKEKKNKIQAYLKEKSQKFEYRTKLQVTYIIRR